MYTNIKVATTKAHFLNAAISRMLLKPHRRCRFRRGIGKCTLKKKIHMMHLENLVTLNMLAKKSHPDLKATGVSINE